MPRLITRGTDTVILDDNDNEVLVISSGGKLTIGDVVPAVNADTSGATLVQLETEVNELKAALRVAGVIST